MGDNKTLMVCCSGWSAEFPHEPLQTVRELTSIAATNYYRSAFDADDSHQQAAILSTSTRPCDKLSPELLVKDLERLGTCVLYLILGTDEGNKEEEENNYDSSGLFLHGGASVSTTAVELPSFPNTIDDVLDSSTSPGVVEDNEGNRITVAQDNTMPNAAAAGGVIARILGLTHESSSTTCSEDSSNSESDISESDG